MVEAHREVKRYTANEARVRLYVSTRYHRVCSRQLCQSACIHITGELGRLK